MKVKSESEVAQSCPTPSDPMDCSLPGSSVHGIFQARVLEWGAIAFSTSNAEEAEVKQFYEDLQDLLELTPKVRPFHHRGQECKNRKSRNTWSNRQIWPWNTE